jgi:putative heme-binding domain-containing protein
MFEHLRDTDGKWNDVSTSLLAELLVTAQASGINVAESFADQVALSSFDLGQQLELMSNFCRAIQSKDTTKTTIHRFLPIYEEAMEVVTDSSRPEKLRCQAIDLMGMRIGEIEAERELLIGLIAPTSPISVQRQSIDSLMRIEPEQACLVLLPRWPSMTQSVREHLVSRMLQRSNTTTILLDALQGGTVDINEISLSARQQLTRNGPRSNRVRAERLVRTSGSIEKSTLVHSYLAELDEPGDPNEGAKLFNQYCAVCHVPDKNGQPVGASLNNLTDRGNETLLIAILDPNRAVDPKYHAYTIETDDGRILVGAIEQENGPSITLSHADGKRTVIGREEVTHIKNSGISLMPEGMETVLPPESMKHLLAHLQQELSP